MTNPDAGTSSVAKQVCGGVTVKLDHRPFGVRYTLSSSPKSRKIHRFITSSSSRSLHRVYNHEAVRWLSLTDHAPLKHSPSMNARKRQASDPLLPTRLAKQPRKDNTPGILFRWCQLGLDALKLGRETAMFFISGMFCKDFVGNVRLKGQG